MSDSFKYETVQDVETLLPYLEALKQGLQTGHLSLAGRKNSIELFPKGMISFALEAKSKEGKHKLVFKLAWQDPSQDDELPDEILTIDAR